MHGTARTAHTIVRSGRDWKMLSGIFTRNSSTPREEVVWDESSRILPSRDLSPGDVSIMQSASNVLTRAAHGSGARGS